SWTNWVRRPVKGGAGACDEGVGPLPDKSRECLIDLAAAARIVDLNFQSQRASCRFDGLYRRSGIRTGRIDEHGHTSGTGHQLTQEFQPLCCQLLREKIVPSGRARLVTKPSLTGSSPAMKTMGIVVVAALAAIAEGWPPVAAITSTLRWTNW